MSDKAITSTHIKASLIFHAGKEIDQSDMEALVDEIIDLLDRLFPGHSGSCIAAGPVDENGDSVK